jgi:Z1 domain-containing protein
MDAQVETLVKKILDALPRVGDLDAAVESVTDDLEILLPGYALTHAEDLRLARLEVERQFEAFEILHQRSVIRKRPDWYFGPRPTDLHWPVLKQFLISKGWDKDDVEGIDHASNEVVSLLDNPQQDQFNCRGLVVGHVQSGKTANMTAVIAKAIDAGYNTIIVLAGLTNKLRYQTQMRMYGDLVKRRPLNWQVLTANSEELDFRAPAQGGFLSHTDKAQLAVVKKNVSPLGQLEIAINDTLPAHLRRLKVLVIDDECDQASVNAANRELDMTAINQRIRKLLTKFPAVTYVGYTATPFANVLIDPYRVDEHKGEQLDDLYPRDFITALPSSDNYFGTAKLFGVPPDDADNETPEEQGLDMIRDVPEEDQAALQPGSAKEREAFYPSMTPSLKKAILYFLACCAARRARGDSEKHMTMLVHTSAFVVAHQRVANIISGWVERCAKEIPDINSDIGKELTAVWKEEAGRLPADITAADSVPIPKIFKFLPEVLEAIEFPVENGASDDRINYERNAKTYIVVGGSILARGLTLEGLMVSYFLRTANQYDTLLQMGRWFGYRPNYEDLPRIWMPEDLKLRFRNLARVEMEIRSDIDRYSAQDMTPMDIAVRIRAIPGMAITGATKTRSAKTCAISFWGTHRQTFRFEHRNIGLLKQNWQAGADLLGAASSLGLENKDWRHRLWEGVPRNLILNFFEEYVPHSDHSELKADVLLPFLRQSDERLKDWNVGIVESQIGVPSEVGLGPIGRVKTVNRAKLENSGYSADIKALMSKTDIRFDCPEDLDGSGSWDVVKDRRIEAVGQVPLLLLYVIDRNSEPKRKSEVREPLNALHDVLGYGIVFPGSTAEGASFVSVELKTISADEIEEIEAEEKAQVEAAGVE